MRRELIQQLMDAVCAQMAVQMARDHVMVHLAVDDSQ